MAGVGPQWVCGLIVLVASMSHGCGRPSGPTRFPVTGTVAYGGQPLAAGRIAFEPDTDRGNKGPAGYGDIVNGRYATYPSMGVVGGPHRVVIEGYSGSSPEQLRKRVPLFPPHITTVDLPQGTASVDFSVPRSKAR